jgi:hypothetical protein
VAKRTIGFENYKEREFEEYQGEDPRPGTWLNATVNRAKYLPEDDQVVFYCTVVDHPDYAGWTRGVYCPLEPDDSVFFRTQDMIIALTGKKAAVTVDWENETALANWLKRAKKIKIKVGEYNDKANIRSTRPLLESVATGAGAKPQATKAAPATAVAEPEPDDEALEDYTEDELGELEISELEEILTGEFEVELPAKPRRDPKGEKYTDALIDAILEAQDEDAEDPAAEEGAADTTEGDDQEFQDGFEEDPEPDPAPEPAKPAVRRSRAKAAAPVPEPEPAAPSARTRRARR